MKLLHISDTHGGMSPLSSDGDIIVHSGDLLPNRSFGIRQIELTFQRYWVEDKAKELKAWLGNRPVLYTPGNHDFIDPTPYLRDVGIDIQLVCNGLVEVDGVAFYGFPWTPTFSDWAWMCSERELVEHLRPAVELLDQGAIDVFVAHGPMFGVLDRNASGTRCGSHAVRAAMQAARHKPKLFLHGHIHEAAAVQGWTDGMIVSNAACTQRVLTVSS